MPGFRADEIAFMQGIVDDFADVPCTIVDTNVGTTCRITPASQSGVGLRLRVPGVAEPDRPNIWEFLLPASVALQPGYRLRVPSIADYRVIWLSVPVTEAISTRAHGAILNSTDTVLFVTDTVTFRQQSTSPDTTSPVDVSIYANENDDVLMDAGWSFEYQVTYAESILFGDGTPPQDGDFLIWPNSPMGSKQVVLHQPRYDPVLRHYQAYLKVVE